MNQTPPITESPKEYGSDAIFHWSDLLPAGFVQFLEQEDLLNNTPSGVLESLDDLDIAPRVAGQHNIREWRARIERIVSIVENNLYIDENNTSLDEVMWLFDLPTSIRTEIQNIMATHKNIKNLADIYILGEEELSSHQFPQNTFSSESLQSLYDVYVLPFLVKKSEAFVESNIESDEEEDVETEAGWVHHYHYPKKWISIFTAMIASGILALIAQERGYIDIHKTPIKQDINRVIQVVRGVVHHVFGRE